MVDYLEAEITFNLKLAADELYAQANEITNQREFLGNHGESDEVIARMQAEIEQNISTANALMQTYWGRKDTPECTCRPDSDLDCPVCRIGKMYTELPY